MTVPRWGAARRTAAVLGWNPRVAVSLRYLPAFLRSATRYGHDPAFPLRWRHLYPVLSDADDAAGAFDPHYFHQDLWAARHIFRRRPDRHVDVGSRLDGFVAHLLTFMPVTVVDIRPSPPPVDGLDFVQDDVRTLASIPSGSVESLSCLHALEHVGLGRYGDPVDATGWRRGAESLARVLAPGGQLYLGVPVGRQRLEFNAHRVFSPATILHAFDGLILRSFAAVGDDRVLHDPAEPTDLEGATYGCGLFVFEAPQGG